MLKRLIYMPQIAVMRGQYKLNPSNETLLKYVSALKRIHNNGLILETILESDLGHRSKESNKEYRLALQNYISQYISTDTRRKLILKVLLILILIDFIVAGYSHWADYNKGAPDAAHKHGSIQPTKVVSQSGELLKPSQLTTSLKDVQGIEDITDEIHNLIDMVKNSLVYTKKGASVPKGVLLYGKPGTGKTLIARAIAGEAKVNFFHFSGSNFDYLLVGVGASRVRKMFADAKKSAPCIIFIDEIDALLAKQRRFGTEHSSSAATLNEFLSQMDGFEATSQILVIGATNDIESLDPAAVRPGRFDLKIYVPLPDMNGRKAIFDLFISKIKADSKVDAATLAKMTPGFSGADIKNMVNQAIIIAVSSNKEVAMMEDFEMARDKIMMGLERKTLKRSDKDIFNTAIHESGHTIIRYYLEGPESIYKTTIVPRGAKLGGTFGLETERFSLTKADMQKKICILVGGHVAEKKFLGDKAVSTQCVDDLKKATDLAYLMVRRFGMSEKSGLTSETKENMSQAGNAGIDLEVQNILKDAYTAAETLLTSHELQVKLIAQKLYQFEYLTGKEVNSIIKGESLKKTPKRPYTNPL